MLIGYGRVATDEQINTLQFAELRRAGCKKIYKETATGRDAGRPELEQCLGRLKDGDTLMVWRLDRLGASLRDLIEIVNRLASQKAGLSRSPSGWTHGLLQVGSSFRSSHH